MQTNARIAAVIEILEGVVACAGSAELVLRRYLRGRRYIGAKDRRAIQDLTFAIIRKRGLLQWLLENAAHADKSARSLTLAHFSVPPESLPAEDITKLFSGSDYAPAALTNEEIILLERLAVVHDEAPDWARLNFPPWLETELRDSLGDEFEMQMAALNTEGSVDIRVNTLKTSRDEILTTLRKADIGAVATDYSPYGLRLDRRVPWGNVKPYVDGLFEPQDEGSQILGLIADAQPGQTVVDLCAGAGGKTLALAATMKNEGRLIATDIAAGRLARATPRLSRAGVENVEALDNPQSVYKTYAGMADRVLADAPCSGSGSWRRQPAARWCLNQEELDRYRQIQSDLLSQAAALVKPGGRLIYTTCSILRSENEDCADAFSKSASQFQRLDATEIWQNVIGTPAPFDGPYLKLTSGHHNTDGVFAAIWERQ